MYGESYRRTSLSGVCDVNLPMNFSCLRDKSGMNTSFESWVEMLHVKSW